MKLQRIVYFSLLSIIVLVSGFLSHRLQGLVGLAGSVSGAVLGLLLSFVSHKLSQASARAKGVAIVTAVQAGVLVSFAVLIVAMLMVKVLWPEAIKSFALTAVTVYVAHRFFEAFEANFSGGGISSSNIARPGTFDPQDADPQNSASQDSGPHDAGSQDPPNAIHKE